MTDQDQAAVIQLVKDNLYLIFAEQNESKRLQNIAKLWVPSGQLVFADPGAVFYEYQGISDFVTGLLKGNVDKVFTELGKYTGQSLRNVQVLSFVEKEQEYVARVKWGFGLPGSKPELTGEDVVTARNGKITKLYTFLDIQN